MILRIVGMDPSMSNWGIAKGSYNTVTDEITFKELIVVSPDKQKCLQTRNNSKDIYIAEQLFQAVLQEVKDAHVVFAEIPVAGQNARSCVSYAMCVSIVAALNKVTNNSVIQVSPNQVKNVVVKNASKKEMIEWAANAHPEANWQYKTVKGAKSIISGHAEHVADAIASVYAGASLPEFSSLIKVLKTTHP